MGAELAGHDADPPGHTDTALNYAPFHRGRKYVFPVKQAVLAVILFATGIVMTVVGVSQGSFRMFLLLSFLDPRTMRCCYSVCVYACICVHVWRSARVISACMSACVVLAAIMLVGILAFLPGAYQSFVLYQTWKRKPGYRIEDTYEAVDL